MKKLVRINSSKFCLSLLLTYALTALWPPQAFSQSSPSPAWSGSVTCQLSEQETGVFNRQETQTWTLMGGGPVSPTGIPTYNATWSVTGQGQLQRIQGAQTTNIQWTTNVPAQPTTLAIFVRGSDNRLIMIPRHSQLRMDNATTGARQAIVNGAAQQPTNISHAVWEWQFPHIEASPTDTAVSGSTQSPADAGDAELLHHFGAPPPIAVCQWQITKGGSASSSPNPSQIGGGTQNLNPQSSQNCQSPTTVQQSFETMKANLKSQYDQLIRGTTDPTEIASLSHQEQTMLANLSGQEQRDMTLASQGCLQATNSPGNNLYSGASPGGAAGPNAGSNPNAEGGPNAGSNSNPGASPGGTTGPNAGSNPNAGGGPNGSTGSGGQMSTPQLVSLSPSSVSQGSTTTVQLLGQGTHWQSQTTNVSFGPQITIQSFTADPTGTSATANIAVASNAATGSRPVMLMTGAEMVGLPSGLSVTAPTSLQGPGSTATMDFGTPVRQIPSTRIPVGATPATNNGQGSLPVTTTPGFTGVKMAPGTGIAKKVGSTSVSAAPTSATYLVTITGLMCMRAITGGGDAIYAAAAIRQYDRRNGQATMFTNANTWVYGDVNGMIGQRKQAGSRGPMGGIGVGDFVPPGFIVGPKDTLPPQPNLFPMVVWQGTLTDGIDALVISPSLWISYGDNSMFFTWNQNEQSLTNSIFLDSKVQNRISTQTFGTLLLGASENISGSAAQTAAGDATLTAVETSIQAAGLTFGIPVGVFTGGPSHDRPIGVSGASSDPTSSTILPNATLVLTREMIEKRLGSNTWTTTSFDFRDSPLSFSSLPGSDRPGEYQMFIQIERQ